MNGAGTKQRLGRRVATAAAGVVIVAASAGCASSGSLRGAHHLAGDSERFPADPEVVLDAARSAVAATGLRVDEVVDGPRGETLLLASRGWSLWDYGALARVIVEPAEPPGAGTWIRVTSRLKMATNYAGKGDYRAEILEGTHEGVIRALSPASHDLPRPLLSARAGDPLAVGTPLRLQGRRGLVTALEPTAIVVDDELREAPERIGFEELADPDIRAERLIRRPFRWERFLLSSVIGVALGAWLASDEGGLPATGAAVAVLGVVGGIVSGDRDRTGWVPLELPGTAGATAGAVR